MTSTTSLQSSTVQPRRVFLGTAFIDANKIGDVCIENAFGRWRVVDYKVAANRYGGKQTLFITDKQSKCVEFIAIMNEILAAKEESASLAANKKMKTFMALHLETTQEQEKNTSIKRVFAEFADVDKDDAQSNDDSAVSLHKKQFLDVKQHFLPVLKDKEDSAIIRNAAFKQRELATLLTYLERKIIQVHKILTKYNHDDNDYSEQCKKELIELRDSTLDFMEQVAKKWKTHGKDSGCFEFCRSNATVKRHVVKLRELFAVENLTFTCRSFM